MDNLLPDELNNFLPEGSIEAAKDSDEEEALQRPEDAIPDRPENKEAREFLKTAPKKGLFMPLGKEVKVMQCWRCKAYGHRTGDRECPLRVSGNINLEEQRRSREDPMNRFVSDRMRVREEKLARVEVLKRLLEEIREEEKERKRRKKEKKEKKKEKKRSRRDDKKKKKSIKEEKHSISS